MLMLEQANYYIAFTILTDAMESDSFNLKGIHIVNVILTYFYLGLLIMCFILSLGNRPQGSKWGYTAAFIGFGLITIYMTVRFYWGEGRRGGVMTVILDCSFLACVQRHCKPGTRSTNGGEYPGIQRYLHQSNIKEYRIVSVGYARVVYPGFVDFRMWFFLLAAVGG